MFPSPASFVFESDPASEAKCAFGDFLGFLLAFGVLATSAVVGGYLWCIVSGLLLADFQRQV